MTAEDLKRIWFNPQRFWAATRGMRADGVEQLMARVLRLAQNRELEELRQFDFIFVGDPHRKDRPAA